MSAFPSDLFAGKRFAVVGLGKNGLRRGPRPARDGRRGHRLGRLRRPPAPPPERCRCAIRATATSTSTRGAVARHPASACRSRIPTAVRARAAGVPILSDVELLFQAVRRAGSRARFVGITGTNGKSTTTALLAHILEQAGVTVAAGANLGPAALSLPLLPDDGRLCAGNVVLHVGATRDRSLRCGGDAQSQRGPHRSPWRHGRLCTGQAGDLRPADRGDLAVIGIDDAGSRAMAAWLRTGRRRSSRYRVPRGSVREPRRCVLRRTRGRARGTTVRRRSCAWRDALALPGAHNAQNAAAAAAMAPLPGRRRTTSSRPA